jgi:hypothetical protein
MGVFKGREYVDIQCYCLESSMSYTIRSPGVKHSLSPAGAECLIISAIMFVSGVKSA